MKYNLITSVKKETQNVKNLVENCIAAPVNTKILFESADKVIGNAIAAIKSGKNPFETMPGSRDVLAGLILLSDSDNREALNVNQKKFDLIAQYASKKENVQKHVAQFAQEHGQSLIKNLDAVVNNSDRREFLVKKLIQTQNVWNQAKHQVSRQKELSKIA